MDSLLDISYIALVLMSLFFKQLKVKLFRCPTEKGHYLD